MRRAIVRGVVLGLGIGVAACGGGVGDKVRPPDFTGKDALGGSAPSCSGRAAIAQPYIVDLDDAARGSLEAALAKKGAVIVAYDCASIRVLNGCKAPSSAYEFAGVQRKERVIQLKSRDDVAANLPFSGGKVSGELTSGRTIDLATVTIGQSSVVLTNPDRKELEGPCEGATHYVASASLGAFSMRRGSLGKVAAVAEMFKMGASAKSESERLDNASDGSLAACLTSRADSEKPPEECHAPLRLELQPLKGGDTPAEALAHKTPKKSADHGKAKDRARDKDAVAAEVENPCPEGFVFANETCTRQSDLPHVCDPKNRAECAEQCEKGSAESCYNVATRLGKSTLPLERAAVYKKACDLGFADGCGAQALYTSPLAQDAKTEREADAQFTAKFEPLWRESLAAATKGCDNGSAESCEQLGSILDTSVEFPHFQDLAASHRAYVRACKLGSAEGCSSASYNLRSGHGVKQDFATSLALLERSCDGGVTDNCLDLADVLHEGHDGSPKDDARALAIASRLCRPGVVIDGCFLAAETAKAMGKDDKLVFTLYKADCDGGGSWNSCEILADHYAAGRGTAKDPQKAREIWKKACEEYEDKDACKKVGKSGASSKPAPKAAPPPSRKR